MSVTVNIYAGGERVDVKLSLKNALGIATKSMRYLLVNKADDSLAADDIVERRDKMRLADYVAARDRNRMERGLAPKWQSVNPGLGAMMLSKGMTPGVMGQSFIVRLMWSWHWIGYNRVNVDVGRGVPTVRRVRGPGTYP